MKSLAIAFGRVCANFSMALLVLSAVAASEPAEPEAPPWVASSIPEPLLYDLALPLGTEKGTWEVNSIFRHSLDGGKLNYVPEVEGAVVDGFSFEVELEFEGSQQIGWSVAVQPTIGRAWRKRFVHGVQLIVERDDIDRTTEIVALYIPAVRFSPVWSLLTMIGARTPVSGEGETRIVYNGSVFAEISGSLTLGLELNLRADVRRTDKLEIVPQVHWAITNHFGIQAGLGFGEEDDSTKTEALLRVIYAF